MSAAQQSRWAIALIVFCCATALVLFVLAALLGRSLTLWEVLSLTGCTAGAVVAFTWAFGSGQPEQATLKVPAAVEPFSSSDPHPPEFVHGVPLTESIRSTERRAVNSRATLAAPSQSAVALGIQSPGVGGGPEAISCQRAARHRHDLHWHGSGEIVTVGDLVLKSPMVYVSDGRTREDEVSCIDRSLEVGLPSVGPAATLPFYPAYASISPSERANYLRWLSRGRIEPLNDVGYALMFIHGLERRLLLEKKDTGPIVAEVIRLLERCTLSDSLHRRLTQFLVFSLARYGIENVDGTLFRRVFEKSRLARDEDFLAVALAWFYTTEEPLPASWALRIARGDLRPPSADVPFEALYNERFGRGLILRASEGDRHIFYLPSNRALRAGLAAADSWGGLSKVPDVLGAKSQFASLELLWKSCNKESRSISITLPEEIPVRGNFSQPHRAATIPTSEPVAHGPRVDEPDPEMRAANVEPIQRRWVVQLETVRQEQKELRWTGLGERLAVGGYELKDPMVYVAEGLPRTAEASCIDLRLEIGKPAEDPVGSLGYYTTYSRLSPAQRANYLEWLATGRTGTLREIGYAFLFFYGLERRLLVDQQDLSPIVKEVVRLLETYTTSGSFDAYLSRFLAFVLARGGIETLKDKWFEAVFTKSRLLRDDDFLAVALAWFFKKDAPLPVPWAVRICHQDPRCPRSVVLDRLHEQFSSLFESRYHDQFGEGIALRVSKRDRTLNYRPASPSLLSGQLPQRVTTPIKIPDVLGIQSQFAPLVSIWSSCIEELRPLSRVVAKGIDVATRDAFEALPEGLKAKVEHPDKPEWDRLVAAHTSEDGFALVEVAKLASIHGVAERAKLTPKQSQALAQTAEYVGLNIEPDARITNRPYNWDDVVSLLRPENRPSLPSDSRYLAASLMLELGIYIAAADGTVEDAEVDQIARFLESQFLLDPPDSRRLEALKRVFVARPPAITGLGKRLQTILTKDQRELVARFLTGIAAANGVIDRKEVTALRSAYRALDVEVGHLNRLLEEFRRASQEPIELQRGDQSSALGESIPPRPGATKTGGFTLDEGLLERLMAETREVAKVLADAMRDGDPGAGKEAGELATVAPLNDSRFDGLDVRFHGILLRLLGRQLWQRAEYESLAREFNLMPEGTLDAVNGWSYDIFNDPIIVDGGDEFEVQTHLLESQK